jgi:hypothetical protein
MVIRGHKHTGHFGRKTVQLGVRENIINHNTTNYSTRVLHFYTLHGVSYKKYYSGVLYCTRVLLLSTMRFGLELSRFTGWVLKHYGKNALPLASAQ